MREDVRLGESFLVDLPTQNSLAIIYVSCCPKYLIIFPQYIVLLGLIVILEIAASILGFAYRGNKLVSVGTMLLWSLSTIQHAVTSVSNDVPIIMTASMQVLGFGRHL